MKLIQKDRLKYYTFENLNSIKHCFSTRYGGVSTGCFSSMNLDFREDKKENVIKNYDIICNAIGVKKENTFWTKQVHEDNIVVAKAEDRGKGLFRERTVQDGYDAIITNEKDIVLTGFSADCVLIFFFDPQKKAIGIAHSGWRGTVKQIGKKTVEKLKQVYGCSPKDILCGIAPAIGRDHFQVDEEVVRAFRENIEGCEKFIFPDKENEKKFYIDLHSANQYILQQAGVPEENIENSRICTMCDIDSFFSHRIMGVNRGSLAGLISL